MSFPAAVLDYANDQRYIGELDTTAKNTVMGEVRADGECYQLYLQFDHQMVVSARYRAHGSGYSIACCAYLAEYCLNKTINELNAFNAQLLIDKLSLPETKYHCAFRTEDLLVNLLSKLT